jgi:dGTPase
MLRRDERLSGAGQWPGELRTPFQRDRDRILYSGHFRRLGGVTQITTPSELHAFHNRLTHTLEVAQVARRIAERANIVLDGATDQVHPDVCESAALAHDLGHPPFGHSGELTLDLLATGASPAYKPIEPLEDGYEGNAQSLRIILKLAARNGEDPGLDLTAATLRATLKYPWRRGENPEEPSKFGVFQEEGAEFERFWQGQEPYEPTLEAQIMDWSDDVAYSTHDFYDFALAGLIPISALKEATAEDLRAVLASDPTTASVSDDAFKVVAQSFQALPELPLLNTSRFTSKCVGMLKVWVSFQIGRFAGECLEFRRCGGKVMMDRKGTIQEEVAILKALTYQYAIAAPALVVRRIGERRVLSTLFQVLDEGAHSDGNGLLSDEAREKIQTGEHPTRVVLDILGSMTDAQAISMYQKLTGIAPISIFEATTSAF